jgi:hypothetical protein
MALAKFPERKVARLPDETRHPIKPAAAGGTPDHSAILAISVLTIIRICV